MDPDTIGPIGRSNLRQIEALNQRGGRTLSIADLMEADTITPDAAGYLLWRIAHGASFLTGAVPGGAGKSTLLADMLAMLPPGEEIVTTPDDRAVAAASAEKDRSGKCYLCHEFGAGMWYGYLWGPTVGSFMRLGERGGRIAGCLHADDALQTREVLVSPTLGVTPKTFGGIDLLLYMMVHRERQGASRAVSSIWAGNGDGRHRIVYARDAGTGELTLDSDIESRAGTPDLPACQTFMAELAASGLRMFEDVRRETARFYAEQRGGG